MSRLTPAKKVCSSLSWTWNLRKRASASALTCFWTPGMTIERLDPACEGEEGSVDVETALIPEPVRADEEPPVVVS